MIQTPIAVDVEIGGLSDDEQLLAVKLSQRLDETRVYLQLWDNYYNGEQLLRHLGISIPDELKGLHTVTGWPRLAVDVLEERLDIEGFRLPSSTDADEDMWGLWTASNMDSESQLAHVDTFVFGRAFGMVGVKDNADVPLLTVESPQNMVANFDARSQAITAALQAYEMDGLECAALYTPSRTIHVQRPHAAGLWEVFDIDDHALGAVPVVMLANRARTHNRYGVSEITPEVMSITDAACRTLLGMEVAREFFGAPQRYVLGVSAEDFQNPDGSPSTPWETYIGRVLALGRDEETGNLPQVGTFQAGDPSAFVNILNMYAKIMASITGMPPHMLGFATDNPASAEAIRSAEARLDKRALRKQRPLSASWRQLMKLALLIDNGGDESQLPPDIDRLEVMWADVSTPTVAATTDAIYKQVEMGYLPVDSEVVGERLGYSAVERARIDHDRKENAASELLAQVATSLQTHEIASAERLEADAGKALKAPGAAAPAAPAAAPAAPVAAPGAVSGGA